MSTHAAHVTSPTLTAAIVRNPLVVSPETPVMEAIALMANGQSAGPGNEAPLDTRSSCVLVVEGNRLTGILTAQDVVCLVAQQRRLISPASSGETPLIMRQVMSRNVTTLRESAFIDLFAAIGLLQSHHVHHLPILDDQDGLAGLVTQDSLLSVCNAAERWNQITPNEPSNLSLAAIPVGIFRHDPAGNCVYINDRCCQICGFPPEVALGNQWQSAIHPDDRLRVIAAWKASVSENTPFQLEYRFQHSDGGVRWVYTQSVAERNAEGQITGYIGTITDISDRKRSEAALQQSEAHQQALIRAIPDLITRVNREGVCLEFISAPNFPLVGGSPADFVGVHISKSLPPAVARQRVATIQRALQTNTIEICEQDLSVDGSIQIEEVRIVPYGDDEVLTLVRDISDRKQAENRLLESEQRFRQAIANAPLPIMIHAEDGEVLQINSTWTELTGYTHSDIPTLQDWTQQAYGERAASVLETIMAKQYALKSRWDEGEFMITTRNGEQRIWQFSSAPLGLLPDGRRAVISMAADVTQHRQTELELRDSEAQSQAILATIPDLMFRVGADGIYRGFVGPYRDSAAVPKANDLPGQSLADVLPKALAEEQFRYVQQALQTNELQVYEQQLQIGDRIQDEEVRIIKSSDDEVLFMIRDISERKRLEAERNRAEIERSRAEQIRQELTLLEQVLDNVLAGYWDWDIPNHSEYLSPGFKRMFGYEDHELPNTPDSWQNLIFPEDLPKVLDCFNRHVQSRGKVPFASEVRYRHKDSSTVWVLCSGQVIEWDQAGNPLRMVGCHIDISQHKETEIALEASRAYYQGIIADQTELICRFLPNGTLTFVNDAYCQFFQKTPEDLLGQSFTPLIPNEDQDIPLQTFRSLSVNNPVATCEHRVIAPDGKIRWQQWSDRALFDPGGNFIEFQAVGRDITDLKEAEAALRESEARWQFALEGSGDGVWDWNLQTNTLFYSRQWKAMLGYAEDEIGDSLFEWDSRIHPDDKAQAYADTYQHFRGETIIYQNEHRLRCKDGSYKWILDRGQVIEWAAEGQPLRVIGTHTDITSRKQAEAQIQQYAAQLEASNRELEAFAYSVSHDLRAPLRAIDGFSKALLEDYGETFDEEGQDYFDRIRKNVTRMGMLIDDLLNLSRVSRSEIRYIKVDLTALVHELVAELQTLSPERHVDVVIAPEATVWADATLMRVMMTNLLQNAWKFTSHHPTARIEFGMVHQGGQSTYFVRDDGAGFDMAYAKMLFGVFQRLHGIHEFPGTGIGLATVQRAIHRHGGRVWAEGVVEQGATFYFTLPQYTFGKIGA
ncbi:MAG: PAS domain S-box protein [Cyanobacteria bacterium P01_A01_bin.123]